MVKRKIYRFLATILLALGILFLLDSGFQVTSSIIGISGIPRSLIPVIGIICISASLLLISRFYRPMIGVVKGKNPITGHASISPLYSRIDDANIDEVFQTAVPKKYGADVKGGKAIVYKDTKGKYHTAFLTETIDTHHRHAAAFAARLVEGKNLKDPTYLDQEADALYEGDAGRSPTILPNCAGFELQYDAGKKKIVGIQQDSWLTKEQRRRHRALEKDFQEDAMLELLNSIDRKFLSEKFKNLDEKALEKMYSNV